MLIYILILIHHHHISVCLFVFFHFFSEATDPIELRFYNIPSNHKAQRTEQDGVCCIHNYAEIMIFMSKDCSVLYFLVVLYLQAGPGAHMRIIFIIFWFLLVVPYSRAGVRSFMHSVLTFYLRGTYSLFEY